MHTPTSAISPARLLRSGLALAALGLASTAAFGQEPVFQFGPSADYISGKAGFDRDTNALRHESGNQPFRSAGTGGPQTAGSRRYTETHPLTGPAEGINVGRKPTREGFETWSKYTGPELFGGFTVTHDSTATFSPGGGGHPYLPFIGYGTTDATASSATYFQTGMRNGTKEAGTLDRLVVNAGFVGSRSTTVLSPGTRAYTVTALVTARLPRPANIAAGGAIAYQAGGNANGHSKIRAVVKVGSQYYISDFYAPVANDANTAASFDSSRLSSGTWSFYYPEEELPYVLDRSTTLDLGQVTFAGVLLTRTVSEEVTTSTSLEGRHSFADVSLSELTIRARPAR